MPTDYHNKGEQDASEGKYDPPNDALDDIASFFFGTRDPEKNAEENEEYNQGWNNTNDQKKK